MEEMKSRGRVSWEWRGRGKKQKREIPFGPFSGGTKREKETINPLLGCLSGFREKEERTATFS